MKKLLITTALLLCATTVSAQEAKVTRNALSPAYRPSAGHFSAVGEFGFRTGYDSDRKDSMSVRGGDWHLTHGSLAYGFTDRFAASFEINKQKDGTMIYGYGDSNPKLGISFKALEKKNVSIDVFGKYGIGWNEEKDKMAGYKRQRDRSELDFGAKLYGQTDAFAWSAAFGLSYVFSAKNESPIIEKYQDRTDFFIDLSAMYQLAPKWAAKMEYNLKFYSPQKRKFFGVVQKNGRFKDHKITLGAVYSANTYAHLMPFVAYHMENKIDDMKLGNDYVMVGLRLGFDF